MEKFIKTPQLKRKAPADKPKKKVNAAKKRKKPLENNVQVWNDFERKAYNDESSKDNLTEPVHWILNPLIFQVSEDMKQKTQRLLQVSLNRFRPNLEWNKNEYTVITNQGVSLPFYLQTIEYVANTHIWLFGVSQDLKDSEKTISVAFRVEDFRPHFFIQLNHMDDNVQTWEKKFRELCAGRPGRGISFWDEKRYSKSIYQPEIYSITFEYRRNAFGFYSMEKRQAFLVAKITCRNELIRPKIVGFLRSNGHYRILHDHINPVQQFILEMLRIPPIEIFQVSKFQNRDIPHPFSVCRWFKVQNTTQIKKGQATLAQYEATLFMKDISIGFDMDSRFRTPNSIVVSLDIETLSHGMRMPDACNQEDPIVSLCCVVCGHQKNQPDAGYWFCLGSMDQGGTEVQIDGVPVNIFCFGTEKELLEAFVQWWMRLDPDAYSSWNGDKYDFPYIIERIHFYDIPCQFGRFKEEKLESPWPLLQAQGFWARKKENVKRPPSIRFAGRVSLDGVAWLPKFKKLKQYTLKKVVESEVIPLTKEEMVKRQTLDLSETDFKTLEEDSLDWIQKVLLNRSQHGKIDLEYHKIGPYAVSGPLRRYALSYYCYFDALYAWRCIRDNNCVDYVYQVRNLTGVDAYAAQTQGQQILVYYRLLQHVYSGHYLINADDWRMPRPTSYEGGFCPAPLPGQHHGGVIADVTSLYPSTMRSYRLSYDTLAFTPEQEKTARALKYPIEEMECEGRRYAWVQVPDQEQTLIGDFYRSLFDLRNKHKALQAQAQDKVAKSFHSSMEKSVKLLMNSTYGFTGSKTVENMNAEEAAMLKKSMYWGLCGFHPIAEATTFLGRKNVKLMFERMRATGQVILIQGDTDSLFWKPIRSFYKIICEPYEKQWLSLQENWQKIRDLKLAIQDEKYQWQLKQSQNLDRRILTQLHDDSERKKTVASQGIPLNLEIETITWTLHSLPAKKHYCAYTLNKQKETDLLEDGTPVYRFSESLKVRGLECVKSDNCKFMQGTMQPVVDRLVIPTDQDRQFGFMGFVAFPDHPYMVERKQQMIIDIANFLDQKAFDLASGVVPADDLAIPKKIQSEYTKEPAHAMVAKKLALRGEQLQVGSKIWIVKVSIKRNKESEQWEELGDVKSRNIPIDYGWYLTKNLIPTMERLLVIPSLFNKLAFNEIFANALRILPQTMKHSGNIKDFFKPLSLSKMK